MAKKKNDDWKFEGFAFPTTTPVPDQVFDELLHRLSPTEVVVLLYIIRRTFGFKKNSDNISLKQLCEGITTSNGRVLDRGTGLSKATVTRALKKLEEKQVIKRIRRRSEKKGDQPTTYELNFLTPVSQFETPPVSSVRHPVSHPRDTQQTVKQQTDSVVVEDLTSRGITPQIAEQLIKEYPEQLLREKIEILDYLEETESPLISRNPAGYLMKAITEDYSPPKGFKTKAEREAEKEERENERLELEIKNQSKKEKEQSFQSQVIETYQIPEDLLSIWQSVLDQLNTEVPKAAFNKWFSGTYLLSVKDGIATVGVENTAAQEWLTDRARSMVSRMLTGILAESVNARFEVMNLEGFDK